jgi:hypothetical protein
MKVIKWECPGHVGNEQPFPCPDFEAKGFPVKGDFSTKEWPDWAYLAQEYQKVLKRTGNPFGNFSPLVLLLFKHASPAKEARRVLQLKGCQILAPCWTAQIKQDPVNRGHGATTPRPPGPISCVLYPTWAQQQSSASLIDSPARTQVSLLWVRYQGRFWILAVLCISTSLWAWNIAISVGNLASLSRTILKSCSHTPS